MEKGKKKCTCLQGGPGPQYKLGSLIGFEKHDLTKKRAPAYTMKFGSQQKPKFHGPGPYTVKQHLTNRGFYKPPAFTMAHGWPYKVIGFGPGPGAHAVEKCPPYNHQKRAPAFKMVFKHDQKSANTAGPGPAFGLPTCIGPKIPDIKASAAYSMALKHQFKNKTFTPGPNAYSAVPLQQLKKRNPAYSMKFRHELKKLGSGPGPQYNYETNAIKKRAPKFSFGVKYSPCMRIPTTADDNYD